MGQDAETHSHGQSQQCGDPQGGLRHLPRPGVVLTGTGGGNGGDHGGGEGHHESRREVVEGHTALVGAIEAHRHLLCHAQSHLEPFQDQTSVDQRNDGGGGRAHGDGHRHPDQLGEDRPSAAGHVAPLPCLPPGAEEPSHQQHKGHSRANGHPQDTRRRAGLQPGVLVGEGQPHDVGGKAQADEEL